MFMDYRCPLCGSPLRCENSFFRCASCQSDFPVRRDIPLLGKDAPAFPDAALETQSSTASDSSDNMAQQVKKVFDKLPSDDARAKYALMYFVEMQAGWKYLTDLSHADNALVIGCGTGISSLNLCKTFRNVFAMDTALENLTLLQRRCVENGINNISVIAGGDTRYLPFPSGFFDLVCLNGVLEQVPLMVKNGRVNNEIELQRGKEISAVSWFASDPLNIQVNFLNEINRMLKANGTLYASTDNKFNYRNFIKTPDKRASLTTSLLVPRLLANLSSFFAGGERYRSYSRSYPALRKILKQCNFEQFDFYSLKPDHRLFQEILFFDNKNVRQTNRGTIRERIKNKLFNSKYVCPSFGIVARKNGKADNFVQTVLNIVAREFGKKCVVNRYHAMTKGNVVLDLIDNDNPTRGFIAKIAVDAVAESQNRKNYDILSSLHKNSAIPGKIKGLIPKPCGRHTIDGQTIYLEDKMRGLQASRMIKDETRTDRVLNDALDFIVSLHRATLTPASWGEADYMQYIGNVIERVKRVGKSGQDAFKKIDLMLRSRFIGSSFSLAHKHGDFSVANILIDPRNYTVQGIIDWDNAERKQPILIDLINLIESSYNTFKDLELGRTVTDILLKYDLSNSEKALVRQYVSVFGCPEDLWVPCTLLYWLYHFDSQIKYDYLIHNPKWMRENYYNVLTETQKTL